MDHTQQAKQSRITIPRPRLFDVIGANEEMFLSDRGVYLRSVDPASIPRYTKHDSPPSLSFSPLLPTILRGKSRLPFAPMIVPFLPLFEYLFLSFFSFPFFFVHDARKVSCDLDIFTFWLKKRNTVEKLELIKL